MSEQLTRRGFFRLFGGAAAAVAVAAVAPTYFIPPIGGWKSDVILYPQMPAIPEEIWEAQRLLTVYYSKAFVANLQQQTPFTRMARLHELPPHSGSMIRFVGESL